MILHYEPFKKKGEGKRRLIFFFKNINIINMRR